NNDGLPDLYFTANRGPNRLYLNKGNYRFEDVTERAGVADAEGWKTGVTMADVNGDGRVDIYVSGVDYLGMHGHNVLYINNGDGTFTDRTQQYGLDFDGYSTQALFFDYDRDGDLDMYLLNHSTFTERAISASTSRTVRNQRAGDRLYRNDSGHFTDVSEHAHIYGGVEGFGLGVVASDLNGDGCPDLYVANDFQENDFLYYNNCDGTFTESIATATGHTSRFSMGVDAADFNNDGRPDDLDYISYVGNEAVQATLGTTITVANLALIQRMPQVPLANYAFRNNGDLTFANMAAAWGLDQPGFSNGAAYVDLNNSGALDLVLNNVNAPAAIYRNRAREVTGNAYLTVLLRGVGANTAGIGAKVLIKEGGDRTQLLEQLPTRGFLSSVDPRLHFGL